MIKYDDFKKEVETTLKRDLSNNEEQKSAIEARCNESLFIVAGPGSGKTTVLALKVLKLIFVDDVAPEGILATTFTRKAATELKSRILGWGDQLRSAFLNNQNLSSNHGKVKSLDFNKIIIGTIDSIAEEVLRDHRQSGSNPPVVIDEAFSKALMLKKGLWQENTSGVKYSDDIDLKEYMKSLTGSNYQPNTPQICNNLIAIKDRFRHDMIDVGKFKKDKSSINGVSVMCAVIDNYKQELSSRGVFDFVGLEREFLDKLKNGSLQNFKDQIKVILVDEYQDTNLLQESVYFELAKATQESEGSITIVGDDDQSLYRFRGATIELFQDFPSRIKKELGISPKTIYLSQNYRSTSNIVDFTNDFITLDCAYQSARVYGKPEITSSRDSKTYDNFAVLGMFRDDINTLAKDLAEFICNVINGGFTVNKLTIEIDSKNGGGPGDIAILSSSPQEESYNKNLRLPGLLREALEKKGIKVFNPRGRSLATIPCVQLLCGTILNCLDPNNTIGNPSSVFSGWRTYAQRNSIDGLQDFVKDWNTFISKLSSQNFTIKLSQVSLLDLIYKIVSFIPEMQDDIEGIAYLETIIRVVNDSSSIDNYTPEIDLNPSNFIKSVNSIFYNVLTPIAYGNVDVNEDLLDTLPNDRISIMSIHQAKGLEFPLVVVDVGSDLMNKHLTQSHKRYPEINNNKVYGIMPVNVEDELRGYSPLGNPGRKALDRAFDDLIRQYFVAFSRAQDVLLLVGLNSVKDTIPHVATGWNRCGQWVWGKGLQNLIHI